ncbi:polysaccharide biosynthesis protein [Pararhizobium mangrovi]|uniref:NAD-dependent epimerase/dehydratase family protein n=1 Tax=Pararhizobium mangrovi TaxID=2590452 RepID=A0A506TWU6_9HYPH|nr:polysaccharide biosynthesis protein [Pararhizobium mangrovi]TPW25980.1 NAD-dependent epimerase/dehydratase family protein [Pararhizobium mangrovi]
MQISNTRYEFFAGKRVIVTGGVGSVGKEIVKQLLNLDVATVRVIDNDENGLFEMEQAYLQHKSVEFYHCDICDEHEMMRTFSDMEYCFHAAALKHVPSCERNPFGAVNVNVIGSETVIRAALHNGLRKVLFTSSDKAVNPTNVMGTSKLLSERVFTAANFLRAQHHRTTFSCTRFGNVAGSRGSVIPLFCNQIASGGPITLTDDRMSRFVMPLRDAASLVTDSIIHAHGGEVFITKMPVLKIHDLARRIIDRVAPLYGRQAKDIHISTIGSRPGEKFWEELSTDEESRRLLEEERFLVVLPALASEAQRERYKYKELNFQKSDLIYHSDRVPPMTAIEIDTFLDLPGVLPPAVSELERSYPTRAERA